MEVPVLIDRKSITIVFSVLLLLVTHSAQGKNVQQNARSAPRMSSHYHAFACEGSSLHIDCGHDGGVIRVIRAMYGRLSLGICNHSIDADRAQWNVLCMSRRSRRKVRHLCQNKTSCTILAHNEIFGDACPGTPKYVQVEYRCRQE